MYVIVIATLATCFLLHEVRILLLLVFVKETSNLAFPVQNYISFILITSSILDIKLQKRCFPPQVKITLFLSCDAMLVR